MVFIRQCFIFFIGYLLVQIFPVLVLVEELFPGLQQLLGRQVCLDITVIVNAIKTGIL